MTDPSDSLEPTTFLGRRMSTQPNELKSNKTIKKKSKSKSSPSDPEETGPPQMKQSEDTNRVNLSFLSGNRSGSRSPNETHAS